MIFLTSNWEGWPSWSKVTDLRWRFKPFFARVICWSVDRASSNLAPFRRYIFFCQFMKRWNCELLYIYSIFAKEWDFGFGKPYCSEKRSGTMWLRYERERILVTARFLLTWWIFFFLGLSARIGGASGLLRFLSVFFFSSVLRTLRFSLFFQISVFLCID